MAGRSDVKGMLKNRLAGLERRLPISLRALKWGAVGAAAIGVCIGGWLYYRHTQRYPSTDDAYIRADVVRVAPQVTGRVVAVPVDDQQQVDRKQLLFRIDPKPFEDRVHAAEAKLALARQTIAARKAAVAAAEAQVKDRKALLLNAQRRYERARNLARRGSESQSQLDDAVAARDSAKANLTLAKAQLHQARVRLGAPGKRNELIRQAQAALDQAQLDLAHTRVHAACKGRISGLKVRPGDTVSSGDPQFALVCQSRFWVYANFKETDLGRIRPGQTASVSVDMYSGHMFHGIVESLNPASGAAFSLLPPENASGNWVKVTQRVPVRILLVDVSPKYPLRVQTSTEVSIDTGGGRTPAGRSRGVTLTDAEALSAATSRGLEVAAND